MLEVCLSHGLLVKSVPSRSLEYVLLLWRVIRSALENSPVTSHVLDTLPSASHILGPIRLCI